MKVQKVNTTYAMATRLNTGNVEPYSSLWGPTEKGQIEDALEVAPVHTYQVPWEQKVNQADTQGVKYMSVALTQHEYNVHSSDDGTLAVVEHSHHNTGFTSWNCSFHDAITYMLWCIMAGVVPYTPVIYMLMFVPDLHKVMTATYHSIGRGFNRGFVSLMFQHEQRYIFNATEHGSQRVLRITVDWMRILQQYSYTRGYVWNQYIPLDVQHVLGRPAADPVHAALTMALHHAGTALSRYMPADVQHGLLQYTAQFTIHVKENFDENENLGSQDTRDKLQAKISGSTAPATLPGATPETALGTS